MRKVGMVCLVIGLFAVACGGGGGDSDTDAQPQDAKVTGAQPYTVSIDWPSPAGKQYQFSAFYPKSLKVRPGDSVIFDNISSQAIHTVSFGFKADRSDAPVPVTKKQTDNPAVFGPCYSDSAPAAGMESCPGNKGAAPEFSAAGIWSTGVLVPGNAPPPPGSPPPAGAPAPSTKTTLKVAAAVQPGSYGYICLLHPFMAGVLEVVSDDTGRVSPSAASKAGKDEYEGHEEAADALYEPKPATGAVTAGYGDKVVAVNKFVPPAITVAAGSTVTWKAESAYEPHTVTFESLKAPFKPNTGDPRELIPGGVKPGGSYSGGFAHSGFIGPKPGLVSDTFSLKFDKAGTYPYLCLLHPGMGAAVTVT